MFSLQEKTFTGQHNPGLWKGKPGGSICGQEGLVGSLSLGEAHVLRLGGLLAWLCGWAVLLVILYYWVGLQAELPDQVVQLLRLHSGAATQLAPSLEGISSYVPQLDGPPSGFILSVATGCTHSWVKLQAGLCDCVGH